MSAEPVVDFPGDDVRLDLGPMLAAGVHAPGVYFNMPEDEYHADPSLSASGLKRMAESPSDYWFESWMNPLNERADTKSTEMGRAYHKRILEGVDTFNRLYGLEIKPEDVPGNLCTMEEMRAALSAVGVKPKAALRRADLIELCREHLPGAVIWDDAVLRHQEQLAGRTPLSRETMTRLAFDAAFIEKHPDLQKAFTGGRAEVSVFWRDTETQIPLKARFDYLKPKAIVDLKTYSNKSGMTVDRAIYNAMSRYRYHLQAAVYLEASRRVNDLIRAGAVYGEDDAEYLNRLAMNTERVFLFVFQKTDGAPVASGYMFPPGSSVLTIGDREMRRLIELWCHNWRRFGTDAWIDASGIKQFDDMNFPAWAFQE